MKKKALFLLLLIPLVVLLWIGASRLIPGLTRKREVNIPALLEQVDVNLGMAYFQKAREQLLDAVQGARSSLMWLRLSKRAYGLGRGNGDFSLFNDFAGKARKKYPGNEDILAVFVLSELKMNNIGNAFRYAQNLKTDKYHSLKVEAYLRYFNNFADLPRELFSDPLIALLKTRDPVLYEEQARQFDNYKLFLDALLLYLEQGEMGSALRLYKERFYPRELRLGTRIAMDAGDNDYVLKLLDQQQPRTPAALAENRMLKADLLLREAQYARAGKLYTQILAVDPQFSWIPYFNLAMIAQKSGDLSKTRKILERGNGFFSLDKEYLLPSVVQLIKKEQWEAAFALLKNYLTLFPRDIDAQLLSLYLPGQGKSMDQFKGQLWEIYSQNPTDPKAVSYICYYLLKRGNLTNLADVLSAFETEVGITPWTLFYRGILWADQGRYEEAIDSLDRSLGLDFKLDTLYNIALVQIKAVKLSAALYNLQRAEQSLANDPETSRGKTRARVRIKIGLVLMLMNDPAAARREIQYGLEIDPENREGHLLLSQLDSRKNE